MLSTTVAVWVYFNIELVFVFIQTISFGLEFLCENKLHIFENYCPHPHLLNFKRKKKNTFSPNEKTNEAAEKAKKVEKDVFSAQNLIDEWINFCDGRFILLV